MRRFLPYSTQSIDEDDVRAVVEALRSPLITQGPRLSEFERALADYCGAKYAVCFSSGTAALHAAYFALGLGEGDEFITTPITFVATSNAGLFLGARPLFADVEPDTGNMDPESLRKRITPGVKLVSVVHYGGHPARMREIREVADSLGARVVEDACHALGARYMGERVGCCRFSDAAVFSFHPVKHITTAEGGAVLTNDEEVYERLLMFRNHGITRDPSRFLYEPHGGWYYEVQFLGFNYRMSELQAALGLSQLKKSEAFLKKRMELAALYGKLLRSVDGVSPPVEKDYACSSYHLYPIRLNGPYASKKEELFGLLREAGLGIQVHYIPVYWHPLYRRLGYPRGLCPKAERFYERVLSIPLHPSMDRGDVEYVVDVVDKALRRLL